MSSSQRVLRPRKTKPTPEALSKPSIKRTRRARPKQPAERSNAPIKSLPLELMMLILENVDSPHTLVAASRVCRILQLEAEPLLYREVNLQHVSRVGSLHQALTNSSRRASLVSVFRMQANGTFAPVLPLVNEILLVLTNLAHLSITLCGQSQLHNPALYTTMLRTLARCTFKLTSLKSGVVRDRDFVHFLRQQTRLESLHIGGSDWDIPQDALPNLKYVKTYQSFLVRHIRGPHAITHLDLFMNQSSRQTFIEVFRAVRHQLVSLKCRREPSPWAVWPLISDIIGSRLIPNLRYLEVKDNACNGASLRPRSEDGQMHMGGPTTALDTLVWSAYYFDGATDIPLTRHGRLACIRPWVKELLQKNGALRRFFSVERDPQSGGKRTTSVMLFTLSSDDKLLEERKEESDLPVWSDT